MILVLSSNLTDKPTAMIIFKQINFIRTKNKKNKGQRLNISILKGQKKYLNLFYIITQLQITIYKKSINLYYKYFISFTIYIFLIIS